MEIDWELYEEITKYIYETLGEKAGVKIIGHGKDCKVKGKSNVEHQIDVLTSHSDGVHTYKTAIECKYWKDTVNKDIVMKLAVIIEDASIDKGVIVSKNGFTEDAINTAKYQNIGLVELREMEEKDWEGRPRIQFLGSKIRRPEVTSIQIIPSLFNRSQQDEEEVQHDLMILKKHNGEEISIGVYLNEFKKELHSHPINKRIEKKVFAPMSQLINKKTNRTLFVDGFIMKGVLTELEGGLRFHPIDEIWLIMKSIFEEKSFTISKRGVINEDKK